MKKLLRLSSLLFTAVLLSFFAPRESQASHYQGSDLTYQLIAPGVYVVTMKLYRDCTGASAPTSATLNLRSPGCNPGRTQPMTKVPSAPGKEFGTLYCPQIGNTCSSATGVRANYQEAVFTATVTFSTAEKACNNWYFSWSECCRPLVANLVNASGASLYTEAYVNIGTVANPIFNNSPEFDINNVPIPLVCLGQQTKYSLNVSEADGDSLLYELVQPLTDANTVVPYSANTQSGTTGTLIPNPSPKPPYGPFNPQYAILQGTIPPNFTPTYPMPSVTVNWNGPPTVPYAQSPTGLVWAAIPGFILNPNSGELTFTPSKHVAGATAASGSNKYAVVVKVSEFREIPANSGTWVRVGYIRRDILFLVEDCGGNIFPEPNVVPIPRVVGATVNGDTISVQTCTTSRIRLRIADPDSDAVTITVNAGAVGRMPGGGFRVLGNGTPNVELQLLITPEPRHLNQTFQIPITIEDNACPIKGRQAPVLIVRVIRQHRAEINNNQNREVCLGESIPLNVELLRPDSVQTAVGPPPVLSKASYTYQWNLSPFDLNGNFTPSTPTELAAAGLDPNKVNDSSIVVTPAQKTLVGVQGQTNPNGIRYYLKVTNNTIGNANVGFCLDTASVFVKINEKPIINGISLSRERPVSGLKENEIKFGSSGQLTLNLANFDSSYTYSWSPARYLAPGDSIVRNPRLVKPLKSTTYTVTVKNPVGECVATRTFEVLVTQFELPNIITPNGDGKNDVFQALGIPENTSLEIFNRWGVRVADYSNYKNEFDGKFDGKELSPGTYYYMMKVPGSLSGPNEKDVTYKGWFDIVR